MGYEYTEHQAHMTLNTARIEAAYAERAYWRAMRMAIPTVASAPPESESNEPEILAPMRPHRSFTTATPDTTAAALLRIDPKRQLPFYSLDLAHHSHSSLVRWLAEHALENFETEVLIDGTLRWSFVSPDNFARRGECSQHQLAGILLTALYSYGHPIERLTQ